MRKVMLFLAGWLGIFHVGIAQGGEADTCLKALFGHYVGYVNDNIRALELYRQQFEHFNKDLNLYFESSPSVRKVLTLSFPNLDILENPAKFPDLTPPQRYRLILSREACLPAPFRPEIGKDTRQIEEVMQEVTSIAGALYAYTSLESYRGEKDLATGYQLLSRAYVLFHDFSALKDALHYELTKLYRELEEPERNNPYARSSQALMAVIVPARSILKSLKEKNPAQVRSNLIRMRAAIDRARKGATQNLSGIPNRGTRDEPWVWYNYVLSVADDFRAAAQEFLESGTFPKRYEAYGGEYYYYNQRLLPVYNSFGEGMVDHYNRFVEAADILLLKMVEEPTWLMMVAPGEAAEDPPGLVEVEAPEPEPEPERPAQIITLDEMVIDTPELVVVPEVHPEPLPPPPTLEGAAPNNLVFLLDVSSSMEAEDKLPLLKQSFEKLLSLMRPQDRVAIVTYSGNARVALPSTSSQKKEQIISVLENLSSEGKTDALEGVVLAYRVAQNAFIPEGNNRIILASDGYFSIPEALPRLVNDKAEQNIQLSVFFFGQAEDRITERLIRLASIGQGNYRHIQVENAERMLIEEANTVREK